VISCGQRKWFYSNDNAPPAESLSGKEESFVQAILRKFQGSRGVALFSGHWYIRLDFRDSQGNLTIYSALSCAESGSGGIYPKYLGVGVFYENPRVNIIVPFLGRLLFQSSIRSNF
jgi:hypothetical protein